jgi:demethylmenaquinone methyltransferase/2-methoxy-6-polyprenyl-1,4-benzoquinol methylase
VPPPGFAAPLPPREDTQGGPEQPVARWSVAREPSRTLAAQRYRDVAPGYDAWTAAWQSYRQRAVETLAPAAGSVVLDVGCGTGLNFAGLEQAIGPRGLIGIDLSPDMLALAHERVQNHGWQNVTLLQAAGQDAALPVEADAALLSAVHDILRSQVALANVLSHLRSGGRVVASGPKWVPWWRPASAALNSCAWLINQHCVTTFEGFDAPWSHLARLLPDLAVEEVFFGAGFIAVGTRPAASAA